jgi:tetratricopeptide (TPR) repeat protein
MLRRALLIPLLLCSPTSGHASDFWDEVRSPGLHAHVALLREVGLSLQREQPARAVELMAQVARPFATRADTLRMRGLALAASGDAEHALPLLRQALAIDASALDNPLWGTPAALSAIKADDLAFASDILTRVIGNMPAVPTRRELFALLGDTLLTQGPSRIVDAIVAYREALRGDGSTDARSLLGLSLALSRHDEHPSSAEVAARLTAASRVEVVVGGLPVPPSEKAARLAIAAEVLGDLERALAQWTAASDGPWREHATLQAARIQRLRSAHGRRHRP